ncbi:hypothetical protein [Ammoniphilus sp. 3BR4]|uniref:hypothetical protein n=1 Tax=Ammoniphilus sp. 3BR4 TaxID=3158265 RepID=UPI003465D047
MRTWERMLDKMRERLNAADSQPLPPIEEKDMEKIQELADIKKIPISKALHEAIKLYCEQHSNYGNHVKISEERKERNPLLRLEGLCRGDHS